MEGRTKRVLASNRSKIGAHPTRRADAAAGSVSRDNADCHPKRANRQSQPDRQSAANGKDAHRMPQRGRRDNFSDVPKYADPTVEDRLLQASRVNKDRMIRKFKNFSPNGTASYERALQEAFGLLNKSQEQSPNKERCNRILMFITDSVPGSYKELLEQYNPEKHLDVIARSNVLLNDAFPVWTGVAVKQFNLKNLKKENFTNPYIATMPRRLQMPTEQNIILIQDSNMYIETMIASKEEEPLMYTSVAKAVYDRTRKSKRLKQGNLLGVAGIDVPLRSFRDVLRSWKIGANNYIFAVDNNGFILFHPSYRPVYKSILKSYYQNVDLNEVEIPEDVKIEPVSRKRVDARINLSIADLNFPGLPFSSPT
ncbi:unnamed protein product [Echinostoma caproni]|uniref:VWFA domain-containing protein n=1 Tax=Echinostoma caproni TaxID=27848 RepID=A0A183AEA6_9TREM|nr:unnamed protein product [Echinostoma caproni]